jgi:hypothetical protein
MPRDCGPVQEYEGKHSLAAEAALVRLTALFRQEERELSSRANAKPSLPTGHRPIAKVVTAPSRRQQVKAEQSKAKQGMGGFTPNAAIKPPMVGRVNHKLAIESYAKLRLPDAPDDF